MYSACKWLDLEYFVDEEVCLLHLSEMKLRLASVRCRDNGRQHTRYYLERYNLLL